MIKLTGEACDFIKKYRCTIPAAGVQDGIPWLVTVSDPELIKGTDFEVCYLKSREYRYAMTFRRGAATDPEVRRFILRGLHSLKNQIFADMGE